METGAPLALSMGVTSGLYGYHYAKSNGLDWWSGKPLETDQSFFSGTKYTNKVLGQIKKGDFHSFPESVRAFESNGTITNIRGADGVTRQMLKIPGMYGGKHGFFEFIKEEDGMINHRFFRPLTKQE